MDYLRGLDGPILNTPPCIEVRTVKLYLWAVPSTHLFTNYLRYYIDIEQS